MATEDSGKPVQLSLELPADLEATYANLALISHSASEIVLDFARVLPNTPKSKIHARIVMTPMNAKLLYRALAENLQKFEQKYGEIPASVQNIVIDPNQGFRS